MAALQVDDEVKLAPWRVAKNVINAFKNSGLMQITGPGDPTGRGEGLSFIRVPSRPQLATRDLGNVRHRKGAFIGAGRNYAEAAVLMRPRPNVAWLAWPCCAPPRSCQDGRRPAQAPHF